MTVTAAAPQTAGFAPGAAATSFRDAVAGEWLRLAAGIMGQALNELTSGPLAQPMLPEFVGVGCFGILPGGCYQPEANWTASMTGAHTASIDLGDGYKLQIDERNSEMTILNEKTGETTRIWGDPHVDVDGKRAFDFWGTSTFVLENGTKITINTEQWGGNPNMYVASQMTITRGDRAIVVGGISQNQLGDLSVSQSMNGRALDAATRDGWTVHENATGSGWRTEGGNVATQADADVTRVGAAYGPGSEAPSFAEFGQMLGAFLLLGVVSWMLGQGGPASGDRSVERAPAIPHRHHFHPDLALF